APVRCALLRSAPSTRTCPASINRFACDRVPTSDTVARKRSSRVPAARAGTTRSTRRAMLACSPRPGEGPAAGPPRPSTAPPPPGGPAAPHADVEDALVRASVHLDTDRVHPVGGQQEAGAEMQVRGREAERPPPAIAHHHPAAERVGPAEERSRARHVARLEQRAQPRAAH